MREVSRLITKVFAYVTVGNRLVVFDQPDFPDAPVQVPAGTVDFGESLQDAVMREAFEETGLNGLVLHRWLGRTVVDMRAWGKAELHDRWFFHLVYPGEPVETWEHFEEHPSEGPPDPIRFRLFLIDPVDGRELERSGHDAFLPQLRAQLG